MLIDAPPSSALAVYAHPDDADISCGGTLARWAASGVSVMVVIATTGDKGSADITVDASALVTLREEELAASTTALGIAKYHGLGRPDGEVINDVDLRGDLVGIVRAFTPHTVLFPDPTAVFFGDTYVNHRDHRQLGWAMLDVIAPAAKSPLYFPNAGPAHRATQALLSGTLQADSWVDISSSIERKVAAVSCHRSQVGDDVASIDDVVRHRAAEEGRTPGVPLAESFRRLRLLV